MERLAADERTREKYLKLRIVFALCVTCNLREDTLFVSEAAAEKMDISEKARLIFEKKLLNRDAVGSVTSKCPAAGFEQSFFSRGSEAFLWRHNKRHEQTPQPEESGCLP